MLDQKDLKCKSRGSGRPDLSWKRSLGRERGGIQERSCILVVSDGYRESKASCGEVFPGTKEQRCWVHKTANVLDKMAKSVQGKAKGMIHEMYQAPTKKEALSGFTFGPPTRSSRPMRRSDFEQRGLRAAVPGRRP